jgi:hypothetical protein
MKSRRAQILRRFQRQREQNFWRARLKTIFPRRAPVATKKFFLRLAPANSIYSADRARFCVNFDKLSRCPVKNPFDITASGYKIGDSADRSQHFAEQSESATAVGRGDLR